MSGRSLSSELCDYIIDHLHEDELSLRHCTLVCRSWLPASRLHLFWSLRLGESERNMRFVNCLKTSPGIALYVTDLKVYQWDDSVENAVGVLVPHLSNVTSLSIYDMASTSLGSEAYMAIAHGFPLLKSLLLSSCDFGEYSCLSVLVRSFPRLDSLDLHIMSWSRQAETVDLQPQITLSAIALSFADSDILHDLRIPSLQKISIIVGARGLSPLESLLRNTGPALRELSISVQASIHYSRNSMFSFRPGTSSSHINVKIGQDSQQINIEFWTTKLTDIMGHNHSSVVKCELTVFHIEALHRIDWTYFKRVVEDSPSIRKCELLVCTSLDSKLDALEALAMHLEGSMISVEWKGIR